MAPWSVDALMQQADTLMYQIKRGQKDGADAVSLKMPKRINLILIFVYS